jgi:hypothetical protein
MAISIIMADWYKWEYEDKRLGIKEIMDD